MHLLKSFTSTFLKLAQDPKKELSLADLFGDAALPTAQTEEAVPSPPPGPQGAPPTLEDLFGPQGESPEPPEERDPEAEARAAEKQEAELRNAKLRVQSQREQRGRLTRQQALNVLGLKEPDLSTPVSPEEIRKAYENKRFELLKEIDPDEMARIRRIRSEKRKRKKSLEDQIKSKEELTQEDLETLKRMRGGEKFDKIPLGKYDPIEHAPQLMGLNFLDTALNKLLPPYEDLSRIMLQRLAGLDIMTLLSIIKDAKNVEDQFIKAFGESNWNSPMFEGLRNKIKNLDAKSEHGPGAFEEIARSAIHQLLRIRGTSDDPRLKAEILKNIDDLSRRPQYAWHPDLSKRSWPSWIPFVSEERLAEIVQQEPGMDVITLLQRPDIRLIIGGHKTEGYDEEGNKVITREHKTPVVNYIIDFLLKSIRAQTVPPIRLNLGLAKMLKEQVEDHPTSDLDSKEKLMDWLDHIQENLQKDPSDPTKAQRVYKPDDVLPPVETLAPEARALHKDFSVMAEKERAKKEILQGARHYSIEELEKLIPVDPAQFVSQQTKYKWDFSKFFQEVILNVLANISPLSILKLKGAGFIDEDWGMSYPYASVSPGRGRAPVEMMNKEEKERRASEALKKAQLNKRRKLLIHISKVHQLVRQDLNEIFSKKKTFGPLMRAITNYLLGFPYAEYVFKEYDPRKSVINQIENYLSKHPEGPAVWTFLELEGVVDKARNLPLKLQEEEEELEVAEVSFDPDRPSPEPIRLREEEVMETKTEPAEEDTPEEEDDAEKARKKEEVAERQREIEGDGEDDTEELEGLIVRKEPKTEEEAEQLDEPAPDDATIQQEAIEFAQKQKD